LIFDFTNDGKNKLTALCAKGQGKYSFIPFIYLTRGSKNLLYGKLVTIYDYPEFVINNYYQ
jgi:hypothetical protein